MTAAYRLKGIGWFAVLAAVALGFYLVSLQVAAERKRLDDVNFRIGEASRDIRALETEFDTRANLRQLERWNGDTLALVAPTADQFVADDSALAALDPNTPGQPATQTAALVVPALAPAAPVQVAAAAAPAPAPPVAAPPVAAPPPAPVMQRAALAVAPTGRAAPAMARLAEAARGAVAVARVRPQAVAMLDRQLLSDTTFGDILERRAARSAAVSVLVARPVAQRRARERGALVAVAHMRLMMLMLLFAAAIVLVIGRLAMLAVFAPGEARANVATLAARGDIVDRNGQPLARTIDAWTIAVHPRELMGDRHAIAGQLAALMPDRGDQAWFYAQLTKDVPFTYLQRRASPALVEQVNALGEPALVFARETQRLYPQSTLASHALGYLSTDGHGMGGMERVLDQHLLDPRNSGQPVQLAMDTRVQAAMESELTRAMATFSARAGGGLVLDVATGEIVAMVSLPTFDPNRVGMSGSEELRNITTQSVFELGSTFKPIAMATAIDTGVVTDMSRRFDATHPLKVGRFTIHDAHGDPQRWLNMAETLIYSSNVATARIADEVGAQRMEHMFRSLGFYDRPQVELRERGRPLVPTYWARTTVMTTAFGHGISITPLQLAQAYAALVNGGTWRPATMLRVAPGHAVAGRRVISEATSARIRQMLRLVVLRGTGRKGDALGYRVGGKTGSAEAATAGGYDRSRNVATFVAAFPMERPRYVVLAVLDSPQGTAETGGWKTAAWNAAPVVGRVIARTGAMLGVTPDMNRDIDLSDITPLLWQEPGEHVNGGAQ